MNQDLEFNQFLESLGEKEAKKVESLVSEDPRKKILINGGVFLNWLGDFFANPEITWRKIEVDIDQIRFTGTNPELNKILLERAEKKPAKLREILDADPEVKKYITDIASNNQVLIVVRHGENEGEYKMLDGSHRLLTMILEGKEKTIVWYPGNELELLPVCEAHVVYDLIRGFIRNAKDEEGKKELYYALKLLIRAYSNVPDLLMNRFNSEYVFDEDVQEVIKKVLF